MAKFAAQYLFDDEMRIVLCCFMAALLVLFSCQKKNSLVEGPAKTAIGLDSLKGDSISEDDSLKQTAPIPKSADEYFNDFIYSFTTNTKYQFSRVVFPLPCIEYGKATYLKKSQWKFTKLHTRDAIYTVFFDKKSSLDLEKDKNIVDVKIEYFKMKQRQVHRYDFKKIADRWMLVQIEDFALRDYKDHSFIEFYQKFASDTIFQMNHVKSPLSIRVVDPDDEFEKMEGVLEPEQWPSFRPELPVNEFTNIDYGQTLKFHNRRIVAIEGSSNGFLCLLYFEKVHGQWLLYRFEN